MKALRSLDFSLLTKFCDFFHVGLTGVLCRYIDHRNHHAENHRKPVTGEKVARQYLTPEHTG